MDYRRATEYQSFDRKVSYHELRYKMSPASGDEWRTRWETDYYLKEVLVNEAMSKVYDEEPPWALKETKFDFDILNSEKQEQIRSKCDQDGCSESWTRVYKLKAQYARDGKKTDPYVTDKTPLETVHWKMQYRSKE